MEDKLTIIYDLIYLLNCALNNQKADLQTVSNMDLTQLFSLADSHKLTACVAFALENIGLDDETYKPWKQAKSMAVRKNIMLNDERNQIYAYMEDNKILHVSLKGIILQDMYPKFGMREMGDNDILFDPTYQEQMYDYMIAHGYHAEIYKRVNHDEYLKPPIYNFEFHNALFLKSDNEKLYEYYSNVFDRLIAVEGKNYEYKFSNEDFYIYNIAHAYKHYSFGGTGLRILTDTYVFFKAKKDTLDISYIERECEKIDLAEFELMCRTLSQKLFSPDSEKYDLSEKEEQFLNRIIMSGAYGNQDLGVESKLNKLLGNGESTKLVKWKYYFKRIFVPLDFIKDVYPFYYRHKLLIPVLWITRIAKALTINRKRIQSELKSVDDTIDKLHK
ncbi:MAG: nucleotidyltransferase family protein [Methanosphaera sp.]|nr:nucleotidyltransferase family protein [Methanosphaera sp.]